MNYIKKVFSIILFLLLWIGTSHYLVVIYHTPELYMLCLFTWLPALLIMSYLNDDEL